MNALDSLNIDSLRAEQAAREAAADEVGQNNFLEMLVAQLENQDPLNPQDSAEFAAQLAQFSTVEQLIAVRSGVDALVALGQAKGQTEGPDLTANIDPANLVGRHVVVYASQVEVDANRSPIEVPFRTVDTAFAGEVRLLDSNGEVVAERPLLPTDSDTGQEIPLRPGDHVFQFDPAAANLGEGVYAIEFVGTDSDEVPVAILPMLEGLVTGAILTGEPSIRMGSKIFAIEDILEVKLAEVGQ